METMAAGMDQTADSLAYPFLESNVVFLCQYGPNALWCSPTAADGGFAGGASNHHNPVPTQED
jgi:hypothetical protein